MVCFETVPEIAESQCAVWRLFHEGGKDWCVFILQVHKTRNASFTSPFVFKFDEGYALTWTDRTVSVAHDQNEDVRLLDLIKADITWRSWATAENLHAYESETHAKYGVFDNLPFFLKVGPSRTDEDAQVFCVHLMSCKI